LVPEQSIIEKKTHGAIELDQIIVLELEILKDQLSKNVSQIDVPEIIAVLDRVLVHASNLGDLLAEIRRDYRTNLPK